MKKVSKEATKAGDPQVTIKKVDDTLVDCPAVMFPATFFEDTTEYGYTVDGKTSAFVYKKTGETKCLVYKLHLEAASSLLSRESTSTPLPEEWTIYLDDAPIGDAGSTCTGSIGTTTAFAQALGELYSSCSGATFVYSKGRIAPVRFGSVSVRSVPVRSASSSFRSSSIPVPIRVF